MTMKKQILYMFALCAALFVAGCQKDEFSEYGPNEGGIVLSLGDTETRAIDQNYLTLAKSTIYIYEKTVEEGKNTETLVRKYAPGAHPATIKLLKGSYSVRITCGKAPNLASMSECFYEGTADFTIETGKTTTVTVTCKPQSTVLSVTFETNKVPEISEAKVTFTMADAPAKGIETDNLTFTGNNAGYFTLPDDRETADLYWVFTAKHSVKGDLKLQQGTPLVVERGKIYRLTFRYSPDLPGYIQLIALELDPDTDDIPDVFIFTSNPEIKGDIINAGAAIEFAGEEQTVTMSASGDATIQEAYIYQVGATPRAANGETLLWQWHAEEPSEDTSEIRTELSEDKQKLTLTLNPAFFSFPIGETELRFEVIDSEGAKNEKAVATIKMNEGIELVTPADYDLWANTLTLHALSSKGSAATFKLRRAGSSEWKEMQGTAVSGGFTAEFAPEWTTQYNEKSVKPIYLPNTDKSVYANNTYEVAVVIDGHEYRTSFTTATDQKIENSDMSDGSQNCFNDNHGSFWDSGNNMLSSGLCSQSSKNDASGKSWKCALLKAKNAAGVLGSGNLFTGLFTFNSNMSGTVSFGKPYTWTARPSALHVKYHAKVGNIDVYTKKNIDEYVDLKDKEMDNSVIQVVIIDWDNPHKVTSGTGTPSGMWAPDNLQQFPGLEAETGGTVIGYGVYRIGASTEGDALRDHEIPICYYDTETKPSKNLSIIISASTSYFGDYMVGCSKNELYLTDFSWVY